MNDERQATPIRRTVQAASNISRVWGAVFAALGLIVVLGAGAVFYVVQPLWPVTRAGPLVGTVDPAALEAHVRMLSDTLPPREWSRPENLERAAEYVAAQLTRAGGRVAEQPYTAFGTLQYRNVIASFGREGGERIVVGAHYDAHAGLPGADDNASGVAGLIELGRLLARTTSARRGVDLVAFTLEEAPAYRSDAMGSWVHARSLRNGGVRVRAMISLEMIGYFTDARGSQQLPHPALGLVYPRTGDFIAVIGRLGEARLVRRVKRAMQRATELPVYSMNAPTVVPGVDFSDHRSYWAHDYPAVMVTDTAFYRNPHYHTSTDTSATLDYRRMAKVVEAVHGAVVALAR